jgi:hypothetical protein
MGDIPRLAPAEERPELHSTPIPAAGGVLRKAKDGLTPWSGRSSSSTRR